MRNGFTLIEAVVSIAVLAIGILGAAIMFPAGLKSMNFSENSTKNALFAQQKIEEMISLSYENIFPGEAGGVRVTFVDPANGMQETSADTGIKKVEASYGGVTVSTLITKR